MNILHYRPILKFQFLFFVQSEKNTMNSFKEEINILRQSELKRIKIYKREFEHPNTYLVQMRDKMPCCKGIQFLVSIRNNRCYFLSAPRTYQRRLRDILRNNSSYIWITSAVPKGSCRLSHQIPRIHIVISTVRLKNKSKTFLYFQNTTSN